MASGVRLCASMTGPVSESGVRHLDLQDGDRARRFAAGRRVHQDEQVAAVEQVVGQVDAADAEVADLHAVRHRMARPAA